MRRYRLQGVRTMHCSAAHNSNCISQQPAHFGNTLMMDASGCSRGCGRAASLTPSSEPQRYQKHVQPYETVSLNPANIENLARSGTEQPHDTTISPSFGVTFMTAALLSALEEMPDQHSWVLYEISKQGMGQHHPPLSAFPLRLLGPRSGQVLDVGRVERYFLICLDMLLI